jgi:hypothetical protein
MRVRVCVRASKSPAHLLKAPEKKKAPEGSSQKK